MDVHRTYVITSGILAPRVKQVLHKAIVLMGGSSSVAFVTLTATTDPERSVSDTSDMSRNIGLLEQTDR
jgi:hypothetical protein